MIAKLASTLVSGVLLVTLGVAGRAVVVRPATRTVETIERPRFDAATAARNLANTTALSSMGPVEVQVDGGAVAVSAAASLFDRRPEMRYLWSMRIRDEGRGVEVVNRRYDDQIFALTPGATANPTFDEVFSLEPGRYQVGVFLTMVPVGFDLSRRDGWEDQPIHRCVGGTAKFTVRP